MADYTGFCPCCGYDLQNIDRYFDYEFNQNIIDVFCFECNFRGKIDSDESIFLEESPATSTP